MNPMFILPARSLAVRSGTRAFSSSRNSLRVWTEEAVARSNADLGISKQILRMRMDLGILQLQAKEVRRSIFRARMARSKARRDRFTDRAMEHPGCVVATFFGTLFMGCFLLEECTKGRKAQLAKEE